MDTSQGRKQMSSRRMLALLSADVATAGSSQDTAYPVRTNMARGGDPALATTYCSMFASQTQLLESFSQAKISAHFGAFKAALFIAP